MLLYLALRGLLLIKIKINSKSLIGQFTSEPVHIHPNNVNSILMHLYKFYIVIISLNYRVTLMYFSTGFNGCLG